MGAGLVKGGLKASKLIHALDRTRKVAQGVKIPNIPVISNAMLQTTKVAKGMRKAIETSKKARVFTSTTATLGAANAVEELFLAQVKASRGYKYDPTLNATIGFFAPAMLSAAGKVIKAGYTKTFGKGDIRDTLQAAVDKAEFKNCLLYTSPSPRDRTRSRMPSSA